MKASTPAVERHRGMMDALKAAPGINVVASADAGWFKDRARMVVDTILKKHDRIDLIFAQNDRMAMGAYQEALRQGREKDILFIGVDAVAGKGYGVESVAKGELNATFIYPTGGDKVMQVAMSILKGQKYARENYLSTAAVNRDNARIMQMQTEHIFRWTTRLNYFIIGWMIIFSVILRRKCFICLCSNISSGRVLVVFPGTGFLDEESAEYRIICTEKAVGTTT